MQHYRPKIKIYKNKSSNKKKTNQHKNFLIYKSFWLFVGCDVSEKQLKRKNVCLKIGIEKKGKDTVKTRKRNENEYLRTGLESASGVATPNALMRCCIVGVADVMRVPAPGLFCPPIIWSGDSVSGL